VCGDHRDTAFLHDAMLSGRRAAEAVIPGYRDGPGGGGGGQEPGSGEPARSPVRKEV
jgi:hypothetical protein